MYIACLFNSEHAKKLRLHLQLSCNFTDFLSTPTDSDEESTNVNRALLLTSRFVEEVSPSKNCGGLLHCAQDGRQNGPQQLELSAV